MCHTVGEKIEHLENKVVNVTCMKILAKKLQVFSFKTNAIYSIFFNENTFNNFVLVLSNLL